MIYEIYHILWYNGPFSPNLIWSWDNYQQFKYKSKFNKIFPKSDLRVDESELDKLKRNNRSPVPASTAQEYAREKGFQKYMECSAKNREVIILIHLEIMNFTFRVSMRFLMKLSGLPWTRIGSSISRELNHVLSHVLNHVVHFCNFLEAFWRN